MSGAEADEYISFVPMTSLFPAARQEVWLVERRRIRVGILAWIVFGFVIGLLARAVVPGRQRMGLVMTTVLGVAGSLIGGLVASALGGGEIGALHGAGFFGSLVGAVVLLIVAGRVFKSTGDGGRLPRP